MMTIYKVSDFITGASLGSREPEGQEWRTEMNCSLGTIQYCVEKSASVLHQLY